MYNFFSYRKAVKDFFREHHEFGAVQGHMTSTAAIYLPIAKKAGVPVTIAHARSAGVDRGIKGRMTRILRRSLWKKADYLFTCSKLAGISVFGKKAVEEGRTVFIPNAIDCEKFAFREETRTKMRRELSLSDRYVIGHVGRFHYAKNHEYLLRVFAALCKEKPEMDFVLLLLGEGQGMEGIRKLSEELQIGDKVIFAGNRTNVSDYYQAMDYVVYPSRYEGLPGSIVEAQCAGLKCLMSDRICQEVIATELVTTMDIDKDPAEWAAYLACQLHYDRTDHAGQMQAAGFDVACQAEKMMKFYETGKWI